MRCIDIGRLVDSLRPTSPAAAAKLMKFDACLSRQSTFVTLTGGEWKTCRTRSGTACGQFVLEASYARDSRKKGVCWWTWLHVSQWFESGRHLLVRKAWRTYHQWKPERCVKYFGRPMAVTTDPEGCFREDISENGWPPRT